MGSLCVAVLHECTRCGTLWPLFTRLHSQKGMSHRAWAELYVVVESGATTVCCMYLFFEAVT